MTRMLSRLLLLIVFASSSVSAAVSHKVFQTATSGTPIVIAILADHYTDEAKFENDVKNFITYGLLAHPYYAAHANDFQIETFFEAVSAGELSKYGINVEVPSQNCVLSWEVGTTPATNTWQKISAVVGGINPRHTIVIGDHPYSIGCTDGEWTYIGEDAAGTDMLAHEMGHGLGQLWDEWVLAPNIGRDHPGLSPDPFIARNCHHINSGATPPWTEPQSGAYKGCDLYELKAFHAYEHGALYGTHSYCLMAGTNNAEFCPVCRHYMDLEFGVLDQPAEGGRNRRDHGVGGIRNPAPFGDPQANPRTERPPNPAANPRTQRPPESFASQSGFKLISAAFIEQPVKPILSEPIPLLAPGATGPIVRLVVSFNPATGDISARKAFPITARYAPSHRRFSEYAYEILNGPQVLGTGVVPASLFHTRSYQGSGGHVTADRPWVDLTIQMPGVTGDMLKDTTRNFLIRVWWLGPSVPNREITPDVLAQLRTKNQVQPRGVLLPEQIRGAL